MLSTTNFVKSLLEFIALPSWGHQMLVLFFGVALSFLFWFLVLRYLLEIVGGV